MKLLRPSPSAGPTTWIRAIAVLVLLGASLAVRAATIDVLWYTYAHPASEYRTTGIPGIAAAAPGFPESSGLGWNLTFYDPTGTAPDFSAYDVLVIESGEAFRTGAPGGPLATPDYSGILGNRAAIEAARGDRTIISGTDADFHAIRGDTGLCAPFAGCGFWDGARGHMINMVNWAGSGNGLGIVSLFDGEFAGSFWWAHPDSFLREELNGYVTYFRDNFPLIPESASDYPLNHGLTSQGLTDWRNSFHAGFHESIPGYTRIVDSTLFPDRAVVIATSAFAAAPTAPVPEPGQWLLFALGVGLIALVRRTGTRLHPVRRSFPS